jgi:hypothetical protein
MTKAVTGMKSVNQGAAHRQSASVILFSLALLLSAGVGLSQPKSPDVSPAQPLPRAQGESEARTLLANLLAQKPDRNTTNTGQMRIRDGKGKTVEIPVRFEILTTPTNWSSVYETKAVPGGPGILQLVVIHSDQQSNQYRLTSSQPGLQAEAKSLTGNQAMIPFAGSDFWIADLGLEFLHWPKQRVLKKEMRRGQPCDVLESIDPNPAPGGYSRVISWIDTENGGILHADAYDARNEVLKQFDPTELKKVRGQRELEEMEMRNRKTGSHTWIKFDLE